MLETWKQEIRSIAAGWQYGSFEVQSPLGKNASGEYLEVDDGTRLYVEDTGGTGDVLFFVYGLGCSIGHWKYQLQYFANRSRRTNAGKKNFRIVWMDFRGHGKSKSAGIPGDYNLDTFVHDIASVMAQLGIERATILGQSMGGTVALSFASRYPSLVDGLVLQGSPPRAPSKVFGISKFGTLAWRGAIALNALSPFTTRLIHRTLPALGRPMMEVIRIVGFNSHLVSVDDVREYTEALLASNPNIFWELAGNLEAFDVAELNPPVTARTLIIAGRRDNCVTPDAIKYLESFLPNARVEFIEHGSHCPHLDDPPLINELIDGFLTEAKLERTS
jgi:pimeloyl-ACP methyl ester carboxylesterase